MGTPERIHVFAFVMLAIFLGGGLTFLVLTFVRKDNYVTQRNYCVQGQGALVWPGPAAPPSTYCQGHFLFDRSENAIDWSLVHNLSSTVLAISVLGPIYETNPINGPLLVTLCETGTRGPCLFRSANTLSQRLTETLDGGPLNPYIEAITKHSERYLLRIDTTDYPEGEVAMKLFSLC
jgi:hypothetical protein